MSMNQSWYRHRHLKLFIRHENGKCVDERELSSAMKKGEKMNEFEWIIVRIQKLNQFFRKMNTWRENPNVPHWNQKMCRDRIHICVSHEELHNFHFLFSNTQSILSAMPTRGNVLLRSDKKTLCPFILNIFFSFLFILSRHFKQIYSWWW